jgi:hypothetical protein
MTLEQESDQRILDILEQQREILERQSKQFDFIEVLCARGILLNPYDQLKRENEAWEANIMRILQTGPSSLSAEILPRPF